MTHDLYTLYTQSLCTDSLKYESIIHSIEKVVYSDEYSKMLIKKVRKGKENFLELRVLQKQAKFIKT